MLKAYHSTMSMHDNIVNDIVTAKNTGFDGIEITHEKLYGYLDKGGTFETLNRTLDGFPVVGISYIPDGDRTQACGYDSLVNEAGRLSDSAKALNCRMIQAVPGPVDIDVVIDYHNGNIARDDTRYKGSLGKTWEDTVNEMSKNLKMIADIAKNNGQDVYFEPLGWAPICKYSHGLEVIEASGAENVGLIIDFWHGYVAGDTPNDIAIIDKKMIKGVHLCDSLMFDGNGVPDQRILRDVLLGEGVIYLRQWIDAVKSTGFDGWYACEQFCKRIHKAEPYKFAEMTRNFMEYVI